MKTKLYHIYTENKNCKRVEHILSSFLGGYTLLTSKGIYQGRMEESLIIEIVSDKNLEYFRTIAQTIRFNNNQESVLVTCQDVDAEFV